MSKPAGLKKHAFNCVGFRSTIGAIAANRLTPSRWPQSNNKTKSSIVAPGGRRSAGAEKPNNKIVGAYIIDIGVFGPLFVSIRGLILF